MPASPENGTRRIGLPIATALVAGNMIGSGVFLLPASLGSFGGISLVGWLCTATGAAFLAVTFMHLSRRFPRPGGIYAYTREGFGDFPGFLVAWGYWLSTVAGNGAITVAFVGYVAYFVPALARTPALGAAVGLGAVWLLTWVNVRGVREAGIVQVITLILKLVPLIAIGTVGLLYIHLDNFRPFNASGTSAFSAVSATAAMTLWAFLGLECATIPAGEIRDPTRTIPRATLLGTGLVTVIYVLGTVAVMGVIPPADLANSTAPFADAASAMWGPWAAKLVAAGAAVSCFGALNGWILIQGQVPLAAAMDRLLPPIFGRLSRHGTPTWSLIISSALITALVLANYTRGLVAAFTFIILLATLSTLTPYAFSSMTLVLTELRRRTPGSGTRVSAALVVATLAFLYTLWAMTASGHETVSWGFVLLVAGIPAYVWVVRHRERHDGAA